MPKKDSNNLLKPDAAVENFLDTLLQESTEKPEPVKRLRDKPNLLLMPDLLVEESPPEHDVEQHIEQQETVAIETVEQLEPQFETVESPVEHFQYQFPLQCLMFTVAGNQLSLPLIKMGSVLEWGNRLTLLPDSPDWFLGIFQHRDLNVKVADTAKIINIDRNKQLQSRNKHMLIFGDENWAITCDQLGDVIKLNEEDVKWSKRDGKGLSLGTIKQSLAILLDPEKILRELNKYDDKKIFK